MKKVVFRVDSGSHIGIGHLMRCLTLAYEFKTQGLDIFFITKNHKGFAESIIPSDYTVFVIDGGVAADLPLDQKNNYQSWLGESWESDLRKTNELLKKLGEVDLVVIDHYSLDDRYEKQLFCKKILIIDDLMNRKHSCDYLLDQNTSADIKAYGILMDKKTQFFLGPDYALLKRDFLAFRKVSIERRSKNTEIIKVLVFFGGGDVGSDCIKLAKSLTSKELDQYEFTFILNEAHSTYPELLLWSNRHSKSVKLFSFVKNMAELMSEHDFFIGAGGSTSWERICLGIPSAIIAVAENQIKIGESLNALKLACYLGEGKNITSSSWRSFFENELTDTNHFQEMSERGLKTIDGNGAFNLANAVREGL